MKRCRVCGHGFFPKPLLRYENMPSKAQFLPDARGLKSDRGVGLEVCQCSGCGLVQLNSGPVPYFKEVVRAAGVSEEMRSFRRKQFSGFVKRFSLQGKKVIEIGCGRGEYLSILNGCGVKAHGLEYSAEVVAQDVRDGLRVSQGFVGQKSGRLAQGPFSAFFMLNFLEHLPEPNSTLSGICGDLAPGAVGLVEAPNFDMILRKKLFSEFMRDHLFYFTKETLSSTLRLNGFDIVECGEVWHDYILSAVVKKRSRTDLSSFAAQRARLRKEVEGYARRFKKVAVWGAGHQALAVLSLMNLGGKISYVVDSAPFKQGRYTPATHIRIVSPQTLCMEPVEAVIVMAASYSDEVARTIRGKFGKAVDVVLLRDFGLERYGS